MALAVAVTIVHRVDVFSSISSSSSNKTINTMVSVPRVGFDKAVATVALAVTSDDSCATEVPGAGPCCDGHPLDDCKQVCDWLLMCDNGYVPEPFYLTDDAATRFPETSDYQPHNCHCRGYEDYNGCFCRQARDMILHVVDHAGIGSCDACPEPTPSPTHSPTTLLSEQTCREVRTGRKYLDNGRRNVDTSKPFYSCFVIRDTRHGLEPLMLIPPTGGSLLDSSLRGGVGAAKIGAHCWTQSIQIHGVNVGCYPSGYTEADDKIAWYGTSGTGTGNCGDPCTEFDEHYPFEYTCTVSKGYYQGEYSEDNCFQWKDTTKFCWTFNCRTCGHFCAPLGYMDTDYGEYSEGWGLAFNSPSQRSDLNSCGSPCTEFDPDP